MKLYIIWYHMQTDWDKIEGGINAIFISKEKAEKSIDGKKLAELNKEGWPVSEGYELEETTTDD